MAYRLILFSTEPLRAFGYDLFLRRPDRVRLTERTKGNTSDQDSDREPDPPTQAVDKTATRHGKRDAPKEAPTEPASVAQRGRGGRRGGGFTGSEAGT